MDQMMKESISPASEKPPASLKEEESDGVAVEPTDITTIQVPSEPKGQSQSPLWKQRMRSDF